MVVHEQWRKVDWLLPGIERQNTPLMAKECHCKWKIRVAKGSEAAMQKVTSPQSKRPTPRTKKLWFIVGLFWMIASEYFNNKMTYRRRFTMV